MLRLHVEDVCSEEDGVVCVCQNGNFDCWSHNDETVLLRRR
jgi:hypothetical protein